MMPDEQMDFKNVADGRTRGSMNINDHEPRVRDRHGHKDKVRPHLAAALNDESFLGTAERRARRNDFYVRLRKIRFWR